MPSQYKKYIFGWDKFCSNFDKFCFVKCSKKSFFNHFSSKAGRNAVNFAILLIPLGSTSQNTYKEEERISKTFLIGITYCFSLELHRNGNGEAFEIHLLQRVN